MIKKIGYIALLLFFGKGFGQEKQNSPSFKLTPEQKQKSIEIHRKFDADLLALKTKHERQIAKVKNENELLELKKMHKKQIDSLHEEHEKETEQIYTPEQLERIKNLKKKRLEKKRISI